jgi:hypothetical protein|tara:strand:- start:337 stop:558 length:222 start_codon:yes stop_codon:yes gene_type:complete
LYEKYKKIGTINNQGRRFIKSHKIILRKELKDEGITDEKIEALIEKIITRIEMKKLGWSDDLIDAVIEATNNV